MTENKIFFLGSGFSTAINPSYPSLKGLTNEVLDKVSSGSLQFHLKEIPNNNKADIEILLSYLASDLPWKSSETAYLDKALYLNLTNNIKKIFQGKIDENNETYFEKYRSLAKFITQNKTPIITLNYDILLEKFLLWSYEDEYNEDIGAFYNYPMREVTTLYSNVIDGGFCKDWLTPEIAPCIYKLHGSINWHSADITQSDSFYYSDGLVDNPKIKNLSTYIVPPVLDKTHFYNNNLIKTVWNFAQQELNNATELYIIGFSLPATDISVKYLFNSIANNEHLKVVYVVDINKSDEFKEKYRQIFKRENLVNFDLCGDNALEKLNEYLKNRSEE